MSNRNPVSIDTLRNNKKATLVVGLIFGALIAFVMGLAGVGLAATGEKASSQIGGGFLAAIGISGGIYLSMMANDELTSRRNMIKCLRDNFNVYENVQIPAKYVASDAEYEIEIDVPEYETGRKVQNKGYGGVFLRSNNATESVGGNFDAIFIPGDAKAVVLKEKPPYIPTATAATKSATVDFADRLYVVKKGVNKISVRWENDKSPIPPSSPISFVVCPDPVVD